MSQNFSYSSYGTKWLYWCRLFIYLVKVICYCQYINWTPLISKDLISSDFRLFFICIVNGDFTMRHLFVLCISSGFQDMPYHKILYNTNLWTKMKPIKFNYNQEIWYCCTSWQFFWCYGTVEISYFYNVFHFVASGLPQCSM